MFQGGHGAANSRSRGYYSLPQSGDYKKMLLKKTYITTHKNFKFPR